MSVTIKNLSQDFTETQQLTDWIKLIGAFILFLDIHAVHIKYGTMLWHFMMV